LVAGDGFEPCEPFLVRRCGRSGGGGAADEDEGVCEFFSGRT
jgi:hypothetical protein